MKDFIYTSEFIKLREENPNLDIVYAVDGKVYDTLEEVEYAEREGFLAPIEEECDFQWLVGKIFETPASGRWVVEGTGYRLKNEDLVEISIDHPNVLYPEERDIGFAGGINIDAAEDYFEEDYAFGPYLVFYLED